VRISEKHTIIIVGLFIFLEVKRRYFGKTISIRRDNGLLFPPASVLSPLASIQHRRKGILLVTCISKPRYKNRLGKELNDATKSAILLLCLKTEEAGAVAVDQRVLGRFFIGEGNR